MEMLRQPLAQTEAENAAELRRSEYREYLAGSPNGNRQQRRQWERQARKENRRQKVNAND